jgi:NCAIR mutase (PurE)-related protein
MDRKSLENLLRSVAHGTLDPAAALEALRSFPETDLGYATLDTHRALRQGHPEMILGERKPAEQIAGIVDALRPHGHPILVTRVDPEKAAVVCARTAMAHHPGARALTVNFNPVESTKPSEGPWVAVVSAGTSDGTVCEEASLTASVLGMRVERFNDVGVAGLHRLLTRIPRIREAAVVIAVAGMEGALPSVLAGLVDKPVIAVPTSTGYGAGAGGWAALAAMLSSCASGVTVVNIDNGFGAAYAAFRILGGYGTAV